MQNKKEVVGVLSLSLILVSTFSVAACLPQMLKYYEGHSRASIENLISIPSFAMVFMIVLSPIICKWIDERIVICSGLILIGVAGCIPVFITSFPVVFIARVLTGLGIGLVNTRAVSLVGERFSGEQKVKLMGIRMSMESLGQAAMTFIAGLLLVSSWNHAFFVYLAGFLILGIYLICVPKQETKGNVEEETKEKDHYRMSARDWIEILGFVVLNGATVSASTIISLRVPNMIVEHGLGSATNGATVLSVSVIAGFVGGLIFGKLMEGLQKIALPCFAVMLALGLVIIYFANSLIVVMAGAAVCGFFVTEILSFGFHVISEMAPQRALDSANAAALVGCNLGSSLTPLFLRGIDQINGQTMTCFWVYAIGIVVIALGNAYRYNRSTLV